MLARSSPLLCIVAHPDDATTSMAGTLAYYASRRIGTALLVATRGEHARSDAVGEQPGRQEAAQMQEQELRAAAAILGIDRVDFMDYEPGTLSTDNHPGLSDELTRWIRIHRPSVVITFGPAGINGNPDHIAINQATSAAIVNAANPAFRNSGGLAPHRVSKLYYRVAAASGLDIVNLALTDPSESGQPVFTWPDWTITTRIATVDHSESAWRALGCHTSLMESLQRQGDGLIDGIRDALGVDSYYRAMSFVSSSTLRETDMFADLNP